SMLTASQTPPWVITRSGITTRMHSVWAITTRQLALWRYLITLMAARTQPWVEEQDKTSLRAPITRTSANWLVPSPPTKAIRSASATSQTGTGRYSVSSVVSTTTSNLLAAWLFKLLWTLRTTTLAGIFARARVVAHLCNAADRNVVARPARQLSAQPCSIAKLRSWKQRSLGNRSK